MSKKVTFKIDSDGNGKVVDLQGFGDQCIEAFASTQAKLGMPVGAVEYTAEFHKPVDVQIDVQG